MTLISGWIFNFECCLTVPFWFISFHKYLFNQQKYLFCFILYVPSFMKIATILWFSQWFEWYNRFLSKLQFCLNYQPKIQILNGLCKIFFLSYILAHWTMNLFNKNSFQMHLKSRFCKKSLLYEWNSGQLPTSFIKIRLSCNQNIGETLTQF